MYITRFTTVDNERQDYIYHEVADADNHLKLFLNDDSGLYKNICVMDADKNTVLGILPFKDGKPQPLIVHGSIVKLKPEWCSPGEEKYRFHAYNIHEEMETVCISCINSSLTIGSSQMVGLNMIEPA